MSSLAVCDCPSFNPSDQWRIPPACGHIKQGAIGGYQPWHRSWKITIISSIIKKKRHKYYMEKLKVNRSHKFFMYFSKFISGNSSGK